MKLEQKKQDHPQDIFDQMITIAWGKTNEPVRESYPKYEDMRLLLEYESLTLETVEFQDDYY